jgi:hypothetical protein
MQKELSEKQYQVYELLFVHHMDEEDVAKKWDTKQAKKEEKQATNK